MDVIKERNDGELIVIVKGRLDTNTAPELEKAVMDDLEGVTSLALDFTDLDYISSAGLRVVLMFHKTLSGKKASFKIIHPKEEVMDVFDMTGFSSFLVIEE